MTIVTQLLVEEFFPGFLVSLIVNLFILSYHNFKASASRERGVIIDQLLLEIFFPARRSSSRARFVMSGPATQISFSNTCKTGGCFSGIKIYFFVLQLHKPPDTFSPFPSKMILSGVKSFPGSLSNN